MCSQEKNCGQKRNSTRSWPPRALRSPRGPQWRSPTPCWSPTISPSTRVTSTVEAVPMADSAMVTMLRICKRVSHRGGRLGSQRRQHKLVDVTDHNLHGTVPRTAGRKARHILSAVVFSAGERRARSRRVVCARFAAPRAFDDRRAASGSCSIHGFPSSFRMNGRVRGEIDNSHEACGLPARRRPARGLRVPSCFSHS